MPDHFDGKTSWADYLTHFNSVADLNGWNQIEKAQYLAISLRGEACQAMRCLPQEVKRDFRELVEALNRRFNPGNRTELYRIQLRNRMRRENESLPQLAQAVRNLALQAYPQAQGELFEALCRDHFLDAIPDSSLRFSIFQVQPRTLDQALTIAVETETFQQAEKQRNRKFVREINCCNVTATEREVTSEPEDPLKKLEEKMQLLIQMMRENNSKTRKPLDITKIKCFNCGEMGHFKTKCTKNQSN
jgi:hypothetical protein